MKPIKLALIAFAIMATISCNEAPVQQESQYDNAAIENMMTRRSIRKYTAEPVSREILTKIMECGINAPNGQNKQSWEVRIVDNPAVMDEIKERAGFIAPFTIYPGEDELLALTQGALRVLNGEEKAMEY